MTKCRRRAPYLKSLLFILLVFSPGLGFAQEKQITDAPIFRAALKDQKLLRWQNSLSKFRKVIQSYPNSPLAQKSRIEIGKYYKYKRDWQRAIAEYRQAVNIAPGSRQAHDAKTAEAAIYYFQQDFSRALEIFQEVISETTDWDQIKYCSYWIKEIRRKMSFAPQESFACGPESLKIVFDILGIGYDKDNFAASFFYEKDNKVSVRELAKAAEAKGLKPKVVKVTASDVQNLNTPFVAQVDPEHYVVVTDTANSRVKFIDPANKASENSSTLEKFSRGFKGYALIFLEYKKLVKSDYPVLDASEQSQIKGGVCWCCPPASLGGPASAKNVEFDGKPPCAPGMPSWIVNTVNLNFLVQDIDFSYSAKGMPIVFMRTYNADDPRDGIFGRSWTFNYNITLTENPDTSIDIRRGDGKIDHFFWNGSRYQGPNAVYDTLTKNPDGTYRLRIKSDRTTQNFSNTGYLLSIKDPNGNTISFAYDADAKLIRIDDPNNRNIALSYGQNNKVSRLTLSDGRHADFVYDANNNLIQTIDLAGAAASFTYDAASYITAITTPHRGITSIEYDTSSEGYSVTRIVDALGGERNYDTYQSHSQIRILDSRNNPVYYANNYSGYTESITTASGNKVSFEYDSFGNRIKIKDRDNNAATLSYDARGNVTLVKDALNNQITFAYDAEDNLTTSTDAKNNIYNFTYDAKSNLLSSRDPDNQAVGFEYNSYGQLTKITDAKGGITNFQYDASGNLAKMTDPQGKFTAYGYDTLGRMTSLVDPNSNSFAYQYDGLDRVSRVTNPDASAITYTYNCCNLTGITDSKGELNFAYDALGRMREFANYDNKTVGYSYDSEGNLITLTYPDNKAVSYEYDVDNRLVKITDWLANVTRYTYDPRGNLSFAASPGLLTTYKYDPVGRLKKLLNYNSANMSISSGFEFTLDALGNRTNIKKYLPLVSPYFNLADTAYSYNSDNQLTSATGQNFSYDNNGNMLSRTGLAAGDMAFTYNYDNQLTQYAQGALPAGGLSLSFDYDSLANRIKKTQGSNVTGYILDPNSGLANLLCETDPTGAVKAYYVYGFGLISKIEGSKAYFYQYDGLGSTVAITDKDGIIKNKYAYDDFGNIASNSTETVSNPFKYAGQYGVMTDSPDLLYMRARYYSPTIGRFINKDPIGLEAGLNLYTYVGENPIRWIDPYGLIDISWPGGNLMIERLIKQKIKEQLPTISTNLRNKIARAARIEMQACELKSLQDKKLSDSEKIQIIIDIATRLKEKTKDQEILNAIEEFIPILEQLR